MEAQTQSISTRAAVRTVPVSVFLMGIALGALTGGALWALRPEVCAELCSVHAFLGAAVALAIGLYVAFGRREGLPTAVSFAMSFGAGVMLVALVVSAARISSATDEIMLEPMVRVVVETVARA